MPGMDSGGLVFLGPSKFLTIYIVFFDLSQRKSFNSPEPYSSFPSAKSLINPRSAARKS